MTAPRMAPLTPNKVIASGPMQQMLAAALVNAADEAPARALRFNPEVEDVAIVPWCDKPAAGTGSARNRLFLLIDAKKRDLRVAPVSALHWSTAGRVAASIFSFQQSLLRWSRKLAEKLFFAS